MASHASTYTVRDKSSGYVARLTLTQPQLIPRTFAYVECFDAAGERLAQFDTEYSGEWLHEVRRHAHAYAKRCLSLVLPV